MQIGQGASHLQLYNPPNKILTTFGWSPILFCRSYSSSSWPYSSLPSSVSEIKQENEAKGNCTVGVVLLCAVPCACKKPACHGRCSRRSTLPFSLFTATASSTTSLPSSVTTRVNNLPMYTSPYCPRPIRQPRTMESDGMICKSGNTGKIWTEMA